MGISCTDLWDAGFGQLVVAGVVMQQPELVLDLFFSPFQLLVNNKIISLDLPVAEVYKKVWCPTNEVCVTFVHVNSTEQPSFTPTKKRGKVKITRVRIYFLACNLLGVTAQHLLVLC